jgi:hypothetical protein
MLAKADAFGTDSPRATSIVTRRRHTRASGRPGHWPYGRLDECPLFVHIAVVHRIVSARPNPNDEVGKAFAVVRVRLRRWKTRRAANVLVLKDFRGTQSTAKSSHLYLPRRAILSLPQANSPVLVTDWSSPAGRTAGTNAGSGELRSFLRRTLQGRYPPDCDARRVASSTAVASALTYGTFLSAPGAFRLAVRNMSDRHGRKKYALGRPTRLYGALAKKTGGWGRG